MTPTTRDPQSLRDALYQLSLAKPVPDAELLDEFVRRYPEYTKTLTEFAIFLVLDGVGKTEDQPFESVSHAMSPAVSRAMSRFQNRLYAVKKAASVQASAAEQITENPFASLRRTELRAFAQRLSVTPVFVMKLRDRQILPDTMSQGFQRRVAEELKVPIELVIAHFAAQSEIQPSARFKADRKPEAGTKQTFDEAVRSSGLTPEQQKYLLSL